MNQKLSPQQILITIFALILGAYARILPAASIGFPVTDGGLFYLMAQAIQTNHFALPHFVEYNGVSIPFAYPPLGFYLAALVSSIFKISLLEVLRWLPAFFSIAFTLGMYPLANVILKSPFKATLATIFFAMLPRSMGWYIMGGGITRAPGQLFLLLTLYAAYQLFNAPRKRYLWLTILFGAGVVLSHPEGALHAAALCLLFFIFFGKSKEGIKHAALVALGILILTAPFYLTVITRHGLTPYINAAQTGLHSPTAWIALFTGTFADEKLIPVISALALLGFLLMIFKRDFLLPAMLILPALIDPRSAASISIIAWALLAALALADVILPALTSAQTRALLPALVFYSFFGLAVSAQVYSKVSLTPPQREAMQWTEENLAPRSRFAIVSGGELAFSDALSEWFPALTQHISLATVQGREWLSGKPFTLQMSEYNALQACLYKNSACVEGWAAQTENPFDYVWVTGQSPLADSLSTSADYRIMYQQEGIFIFEKQGEKQ